MEEVVERGNLKAALKRVRKNKGSPGIDGMTVDELPAYLCEHWPSIREQLLAGAYQPQPVRRQEIPKSGGGMRELGIPTVLDRFIQQAICRCCSRDSTRASRSTATASGRGAARTMRCARRSGTSRKDAAVVVDVDLEKFFDRVNHDVLMGRLAKRIEDQRMLGLIRRYLEAGMMANGVVMERHEGTPQGGPLSPLLANVLLDEVDKELEKRGHAFVRYADDCNVYVRSRRAGERVMETLRRLYARAPAANQRGEERGGAGRGTANSSATASGWPRDARSKRRVARQGPRSDEGARPARSPRRTRRAEHRRRSSRSCASYLRRLEGVLPPRGYAPESSATWTSGFAIACARCNSSSGNEARRSSANCAPGAVSEHVAATVAANGPPLVEELARMAIHIAFPISYFDELGLPRLAA